MKYVSSQKMNVFSVLVVVLPVLSVYASGILGFTVGDVLLVAVSIVYMLRMTVNRRAILRLHNTASPIWALIIAIIFTSLIDIMIVPDVNVNDILIRVIRRVFYYLCVVLLSPSFFRYENSAKIVIKVGLVAAGYLGVQYVLYYAFGFVLTGFLHFLPVYHENYAAIDYSSLYQSLQYRPTSFLLEPAHASRYLCIPLVISLFENRIKLKYRTLISLVLSIAIAMTTSGMGIISVMTIWLIFVGLKLWNSIQEKRIKKSYIFGIVAMLVIIYIALQNSVIQGAFFRISNSDLANVNTAGGARYRGYIQYFMLPLTNKTFGMGYGSVPSTNLVTWFSGASYILYGCGIVGFLACMYLFIRIFSRLNNPTGRVILLVWGMMFFMDDSFMSHVAVVYFSFICSSNIVMPQEQLEIRSML